MCYLCCHFCKLINVNRDAKIIAVVIITLTDSLTEYKCMCTYKYPPNKTLFLYQIFFPQYKILYPK